jgi:AcrR family transcriptional regulator
MIFKAELADLVLEGRKTATRRLLSDKPKSPWYSEACRSVSVADVVGRAGIARNTFYELFRSKDDAFRHALTAALEAGIEAVGGGADPVAALVDFVNESPSEARCLLIEAPQGAPDQYEQSLDRIVTEVFGADNEIGRMVVGGSAAILYRCLEREEEIDVDGLRAFIEPHLRSAVPA